MTIDHAPLATPRTGKSGIRAKKIAAYLTDWRLILPGFLIAGYAAGILSALVISGSHPIAMVHQGPYALTGIYKGKVYELIPLEDAVRLRHDQSQPQKARIRKIGSRNPVIEDLVFPPEDQRKTVTIGPH